MNTTTKVEVIKRHAGMNIGDVYNIDDGALDFRISNGLVKLYKPPVTRKKKKLPNKEEESK